MQPSIISPGLISLCAALHSIPNIVQSTSKACSTPVYISVSDAVYLIFLSSFLDYGSQYHTQYSPTTTPHCRSRSYSHYFRHLGAFNSLFDEDESSRCLSCSKHSWSRLLCHHQKTAFILVFCLVKLNDMEHSAWPVRNFQAPYNDIQHSGSDFSTISSILPPMTTLCQWAYPAWPGKRISRQAHCSQTVDFLKEWYLRGVDPWDFAADSQHNVIKVVNFSTYWLASLTVVPVSRDDQL